MARKGRAEAASPAEAASAPRRKRMTQEERTALSDRRMFEAAMALICEKGAHRTTLKEICERAGYSRGLANYRFGSKDAFFDQLIGHFNQAWKEHLQAHVGARRGAEAIRAAIDAFESFLLEHGDYMRSRYIIMYESIATDNVISRKLRLAHRIYHNDLADWVRQGIQAGEIAPELDPDDFAAWYNAFIFGTVFQWLVAPEQVDVRRLCAFFRHQVERALAAPAGTTEG